MVDIGVWHRTESSVGVGISCGGVRQKDDPIVAKHRVPCGDVAAILIGRTGDNDGINSPFSQNNVQVRAKETAVAMLLDDVLPLCRRELRVNIHPRSSID